MNDFLGKGGRDAVRIIRADADQHNKPRANFPDRVPVNLNAGPTHPLDHSSHFIIRTRS
jgi:hypothetical protein